jgi:regulatory protein
MEPGSEQEERLVLPVAVARALEKRRDSGEIHPCSRAELRFIVGELARACASARIERLIDKRDYSAAELRDKLRRDGYADKTVETCVMRAIEARLVDDARYADVFVRSKLSAGWGAQRIERELSRRGVEVSILPGWPYEYFDPEDELTRALEVASRKRVREPHAYEKLVRFLCGRGFAPGVAHRAARRTLEEREDEAVGF